VSHIPLSAIALAKEEEVRDERVVKNVAFIETGSLNPVLSLSQHFSVSSSESLLNSE